MAYAGIHTFDLYIYLFEYILASMGVHMQVLGDGVENATDKFQACVLVTVSATVRSRSKL